MRIFNEFCWGFDRACLPWQFIQVCNCGQLLNLLEILNSAIKYKMCKMQSFIKTGRKLSSVIELIQDWMYWWDLGTRRMQKVCLQQLDTGTSLHWMFVIIVWFYLAWSVKIQAFLVRNREKGWNVFQKGQIQCYRLIVWQICHYVRLPVGFAVLDL